MDHVVTAEFVDRDRAASALRALRAHHYPADHISVIDRPNESTTSYGSTFRENKRLPRETGPGVWGGAAWGLGGGFCMGLTAMAMVPTLILAMPFFLVAGALLGGLLGTMGGLQIAQRDPSKSESALEPGAGALIVVHDEDPNRAQEALDLLRDEGALLLGVRRQ